MDEGSDKLPPKVFRQAFDDAPIGIAIVGGDASWIYVNEELCNIFGYAPDEFKKLTWRELTYDEDLEPDQQEVDKCLRRNGPSGYSMEKRYRRKNANETFWASLVVSVVRDGRGNFQNFVSYIVPCSRPAAVLICWAWALKNWKPIGSAIASSVIFLCWAFEWVSEKKLAALKRLLLD